MPSSASSDTQFFQGLATLFKCPAEIPSSLSEAVFAIEDLASPEGQERLEAGLERAGMESNLQGAQCPEQVGVQLWLLAPAIVLREHDNLHAPPLTSFACFGAKTPSFTRSSLALPDSESLCGLRNRLDEWFAAHQRGREAVRVDLHAIDGELSFLVRHADLLTWTHRVDGRQTDSLQLRRKKTDVIVYSSEHDEIRISAETGGERELYRTEFGRLLRGNAGYFSTSTRYTLEPLRWERQDVLAAQSGDGIRKIVLRKLEMDWCNENHDLRASNLEQIFQRCDTCALPTGGRLSRAVFLIHFADSTRPRAVEVVPPNTLNLERASDADAVTRWLCDSWLLVADQTRPNRAEAA